MTTPSDLHCNHSCIPWRRPN